MSASSPAKLTQTSKASCLLSYQKGIKNEPSRLLGFVCSHLLGLNDNLLAELTWEAKGGAHFRDLLHATEMVSPLVLLLCCAEATLRTGFLRQRWGQAEGEV